MYCIPGFEEDPDWLNENIDKVCRFLSGGRVNRWEGMASKFLTESGPVQTRVLKLVSHYELHDHESGATQVHLHDVPSLWF